MNYEGILTNDPHIKNDGFMNADIFKKISPTKANVNSINILKKLCSNPSNSIYVISSLEKHILEEYLGSI